MRPIQSTADLPPDAVLHHPAFGFARVRALHDDHVELVWERHSDHLPTEVSTEGVLRSYLVCAEDGFFARAIQRPDLAREQLLLDPAEALVDLLHELDDAQRVRDIMDWCIGCSLFSAKTFVRWWGTTEAALRDDSRITLDGEWVRLAELPSEPLRIQQLAPNHASSDPSRGATGEDDVSDVDDIPDASHLLTAAEVAGDVPVRLVDAQLDPRAFLHIGTALAEALVDALERGRPAAPSPADAWLTPEGLIYLGDQDFGQQPTAGEEPSAIDPIPLAAALLIEAFLGRAIPAGAFAADLLPFLRHRLDGLPPSALAPLTAALHPDAQRRPTPAAWLAQWRASLAAEQRRLGVRDLQARLTVGYDSHIGRVKLLTTQINQDCLYVARRGSQRLCVLCDGISVSDTGRGDLASKLVTSAIGRLWENLTDAPVSPRRLLDRALQLANRTVCERVLRLANGNLAGRMPMGTTVIAALTRGAHVHLAWLGDSRAYLAGPWGVSQLTADDNVSGDRLHAWCTGSSRTWTNTQHALVRYVGHFDAAWQPAALAAHHFEFTLLPGERLLLCSDGITDYIDSHESSVAARIQQCLALPDTDEAARALVNLANKAGGGDNATAIVIAGPAGD